MQAGNILDHSGHRTREGVGDRTPSFRIDPQRGRSSSPLLRLLPQLHKTGCESAFDISAKNAPAVAEIMRGAGFGEARTAAALLGTPNVLARSMIIGGYVTDPAREQSLREDAGAGAIPASHIFALANVKGVGANDIVERYKDDPERFERDFANLDPADLQRALAVASGPEGLESRAKALATLVNGELVAMGRRGFLNNEIAAMADGVKGYPSLLWNRGRRAGTKEALAAYEALEEGFRAIDAYAARLTTGSGESGGIRAPDIFARSGAATPVDAKQALLTEKMNALSDSQYNRIREALGDSGVYGVLSTLRREDQAVMVDLNIRHSELENRYVHAKLDTGNKALDMLGTNLIREAPFIAAEALFTSALGEAKIAYDVAKYGVKFAATFKDCFQNKNMTFGEAFVAAGKEVGVEIIIDKGVPVATKVINLQPGPMKNIADAGGTTALQILRP